MLLHGFARGLFATQLVRTTKDLFMKFLTGRSIGLWLQDAADEEISRKLDEQLENSFPASDPPSHTRTPIAHGNLHALKSAWDRATRTQSP